MPRGYTAVFEDIAISAVQDLFEILAATNTMIEVLEWNVFQTSDFGDAEEEILALEEVRGVGSVTSGSGGASVTPEADDTGDSAAQATVERNNTTRMAVGTGTLDNKRKYGFNIRAGEPYTYIPEARPKIYGGDRWTLGLNDAPADALTVSGYVHFLEHGG